MKVEDLQMGDHFYLRFLGWSRELKLENGSPVMSPSETQLLEVVTVHALENNTLSVQDAISLSHMGSPTTLHTRLRRLRNLDLLAVQRKIGEHRTKYLVPTPKALMHFESQGKALYKALSDAALPA